MLFIYCGFFLQIVGCQCDLVWCGVDGCVELQLVGVVGDVCVCVCGFVFQFGYVGWFVQFVFVVFVVVGELYVFVVVELRQYFVVEEVVVVYYVGWCLFGGDVFGVLFYVELEVLFFVWLQGCVQLVDVVVQIYIVEVQGLFVQVYCDQLVVIVYVYVYIGDWCGVGVVYCLVCVDGEGLGFWMQVDLVVYCDDVWLWQVVVFGQFVFVVYLQVVFLVG